jgi:DNA repair ATPase RecN
MIGFQLRALEMTGLGVAPARITFGPGLNVISGASDTGKSFLFHAIDYMFGASSLDLVPEARPYGTIELEIEADEGRFLLSRGLNGGGFELRDLTTPGNPTTLLGERLVAGDPENISSFLLRLSGFQDKKVRKNVDNELQNLSFRNLARLVMVDE